MNPARALVALALVVLAVSGAAAGVPPAKDDPGSEEVRPLSPNSLNGYGRQSGDQFRPQGLSGNNPVDDNYRRGVFGPRRRRVPYGESDKELQSQNPYHQFNNARNLPMDVFKPRGGQVDDLAHQKRLADYARQSRAFSLPYGGYSSFRNHVFRRATGDRLFRHNLHRSVNGEESQVNPMGVTVERSKHANTPAAAQDRSLAAAGLPRGLSLQQARAMLQSFPYGPNGPAFAAHVPEPNVWSDGTAYFHPGNAAFAHARATPYGSVLDGTNPYAANGGSYNPYLAGYYGPGAVNPYAAGMAGVSPYAVPGAFHGVPAYGHPAAALPPRAELASYLAQQGVRGGAGAHAYAYDPLHWHHNPSHWAAAAHGVHGVHGAAVAETVARGQTFHRAGNRHARKNDNGDALTGGAQSGNTGETESPDDQPTTEKEVKEMKQVQNELDDGAGGGENGGDENNAAAK